MAPFSQAIGKVNCCETEAEEKSRYPEKNKILYVSYYTALRLKTESLPEILTNISVLLWTMSSEDSQNLAGLIALISDLQKTIQILTAKLDKYEKKNGESEFFKSNTSKQSLNQKWWIHVLY